MQSCNIFDIDTDDINDVVIECHPLMARWRELASRLKIIVLIVHYEFCLIVLLSYAYILRKTMSAIASDKILG